MKSNTPISEAIPHGTIIKKTHRQLYVSLKYPPIVGARIGPRTTPMPNIALAEPIFSLG